MENPKVKVFPSEDGEYYWHLIGRNGEIQCQGEGYTRREDAVRGVFSTAETFFRLVGFEVDARKALGEAIEIIEEDGSVLTLEEAGYGQGVKGIE